MWENALGFASIAGMALRFLRLPLGAVGEIIKLVGGILVAVLLVFLAFSPFFGVGLATLTGSVWIAIPLYIGLGFAAASIIGELVGI